MHVLALVLLLLGCYPLWRAWQANRQTSLSHAVLWAGLAWASWLGTVAGLVFWPDSPAVTVRYLSLCMTGCAAVAVLGARRPGMVAWNAVVVGLLAVFLLPLAEGLGTLQLSLATTLFLGGTLFVGVLNYLPTRLGLAIVLMGTACSVELLDLYWHESDPELFESSLGAARVMIATGPLVAWLAFGTRTQPGAEFDRIWLDFRDRYGLVWGQRMREQFNRAAANAGWPVVLRWSGIRLTPGATMPAQAVQEEIVKTLQAVLKRFGPEEE